MRLMNIRMIWSPLNIHIARVILNYHRKTNTLDLVSIFFCFLENSTGKKLMTKSIVRQQGGDGMRNNLKHFQLKHQDQSDKQNNRLFYALCSALRWLGGLVDLLVLWYFRHYTASIIPTNHNHHHLHYINDAQ